MCFLQHLLFRLALALLTVLKRFNVANLPGYEAVISLSSRGLKVRRDRRQNTMVTHCHDLNMTWLSTVMKLVD